MAGESQTLTYERTTKVLNEFAQAVVEAYKNGVQTYDAIASGQLLSRVSVGTIDTEGGHITVSINLMDYWKYVEAGRQAGKMPPVSAIEQWLTYKRNINADTKRGVPSYAALTPTLDELNATTDTANLAWAIATNIKKYGIKPRPILAESLEETMKNFELSIVEALAEDVGNSFTTILGSLWSDAKLEKVDGVWMDASVTDIMVL